MASTIKYVKNRGGLVSSVTEEVFDQLMSRPAQDGKLEFKEATAEEAAECDARENPAPAAAESEPAESEPTKGKGK